MAKHKSLKEIEGGWNSIDRPKDGTIYQHYKGGEYKIVATGYIEGSETPCIIYQSLENHIVWVRTAINFLELIEYESNTIGRFRPV